jgi:hypothetical protein
VRHIARNALLLGAALVGVVGTLSGDPGHALDDLVDLFVITAR